MSDLENNTGDCNTGDCNTGDCNTGDCNTGDCNTGDCNTGDCNTGYRNTGDCNTGYRNTGYGNTGDCNTGYGNTGYYNTGYYNTGHYNTGSFNTTTPDTVNFFNKPYSLKEWNKIYKPDWIYKPSSTTWVKSKDMTEEEKIVYPSYKTTGGYLRVNDMKQEWWKALESASEKEIQQVRDLPNFDYDVFEEITGLDIRIKTKSETPKHVCEDTTVFVDGVEYKLVRGK